MNEPMDTSVERKRGGREREGGRERYFAVYYSIF